MSIAVLPFVDLSGGTNETPELSRYCIQPPSFPRRFLEPYARPIKAAVAQALGTPLDLFQRIMIAPSAITVVAYRRGGPSVLTVNSLAGDLAWLGGGKA